MKGVGITIPLHQGFKKLNSLPDEFKITAAVIQNEYFSHEKIIKDNIW